LAIFLLAIWGWNALVPGQWGGVQEHLASITPQEFRVQVLTHWLLFPIFATLQYFPWTFLVWPAYCMAFRPLEKDPVRCHYLRTICVSIFLLFWLVPAYSLPTTTMTPMQVALSIFAHSAETLLPLVGPMSVLVGAHSELLIRRHRKQLLLLPRVLSLTVFVLTALCVLVMALQHARLLSSVHELSLESLALGLAVAVIMALVVRRQRKDLPVWLSVAGGVASLSIVLPLFLALLVTVPKNSAIRLASEAAANTAPETVIYTTYPADDINPVLVYHMNRQVRHITSTEEGLPVDEVEVYFFGPDKMPVAPDRDFTEYSEPFLIGEGDSRIWRGVKR
jgi:hypothetical protein